MRRLSSLGYVAVIILLYLFVFNPNFVFLPASAMKCTYPVFFLLFLFYFKKYSFKEIKGEILSWMLVVIYSFVVLSLTNNSLWDSTSLFLRNFFAIFEIVLIPYLVARFLKDKLSEKEFVTLFGILFSLAAISTLVCLLSPRFNMFVKYSLLKLNVDNEILTTIDFRGFGIAGELFFSYACAMGLVFSYLFERYQKQWIILLFVLPICVLCNARIGIVFVILTIIYGAMFSARKFLRYGLFFVATVLIVGSFFDFSALDNTINYVVEGIEDTESLTRGELSGNYNSLFDSMVILPESIETWIFGSGVNLNSRGNFIHSDIGYIGQLNFGGVIYCLLLLSFVFKTFKKLKPYMPGFAIVTLLSLLIINYKGPIFGSNTCIKAYMIIYFFYTIGNVSPNIINKDESKKYFSK